MNEALAYDYTDSRICDLCHVVDGNIGLKCFQEAWSLDPFVDHFSVMMSFKSILFIRPLRKKFNAVVQMKPNFTIADIYPEVWKPVFERCQTLIKGLVDQSMTLSFVDANLRDHSEDLHNIIHNLAVGISKCSTMSLEQTSIRNALWKVKQYWRLCEYQAGAQVFLQLRDVLHLKGDFDLVERFSMQVKDH